MAGPEITPDIDPKTGEFIRAYGTPEQRRATGYDAPPPLSFGGGGAPQQIAPLQPYDPKDMPTVSGQAIGVDSRSDVDKFRDNVKDALHAPAAEAFDKSFRQTMSDHPLLNWGVNVAPYALGGMVLGPLGALAGAAAPKLQLPPPTNVTQASPPAAQPQVAPAQQTQVPTVTPDQLPNAPRQMTLGMGPGGGAGGLGSDRALQNAQNDAILGQQALVDKRTEEAGSQLQALNFEADAQSADAHMRGIFAAHQKGVDESIQKEQADFEKLRADEIDKASKLGVDPGRVFRNMDTGTRVSMLIGAVAAGALSGLTGQANSFLPMMAEVVRNDVDAQNKNIDQAWKKVGGMQTTYENLVRRGMDRRVAENTYLSQIVDSTERELQARLAKAQLPAEKANLEAGIQSLQNQRGAMDVQMQEYWKAIYERRSAAAAAAAAAQAERLFRHGLELYNAQTERMKAERPGEEAADKTNNAFFATGLLPGGGGQVGTLAASPENRGKLEEAARNHEKMTRAIAEVRRLRGAVAGGTLGRLGTKMTPGTLAWERQVEDVGSKMTEALNQGSGMGAYDKGTAELLKKRVADLRSVGPAGDQLMDQLERDTDSDYKAFLNANGGRPAARIFVDGKWRVVEIPSTAPGAELRAPAGGGVGSVPGAKPYGQ